MKEKAYANSPALIQDLKDKIREANDDIIQPLYNLPMKNYMKRICSRRRVPEGHLVDDFFPFLTAYLHPHNVMNMRPIIIKKKHLPALIRKPYITEYF